jgi:hypothetical protein
LAPKQDVAALVAFGTWEEFFVKEHEYLLVLHQVFDHSLLVLGCEAGRALQLVKTLALALSHVMPDRLHAVFKHFGQILIREVVVCMFTFEFFVLHPQHLINLAHL